MIPNLSQSISTLMNELKQVEIARAGGGKRAHVRSALRMATNLDDERNRLFVKLNAQWQWIADHEDDPPDDFEQKFETYQRTLAIYCTVNDALAAAKAVL